MKKMLKKPASMLCIALLICLMSGLGASLVKTGGGSVTVKELYWETPSGHEQHAQLFVPDTATKDSTAPAIVTVHGWGATLEAQSPNYVEMSRRGYVVLAIDMYGHGESENLPIDTWWDEGNAANGVYDGVQLVASLPYVDATKIGIMGHSNGAYSCNRAVLLDNEADTQLIAAVLFECNDAFYTDEILYARYFDESTDTNFANVYGSRDVGMIAAKYDECFHRVRQTDGTLLPPREFIHSTPAQSFLNFGVNPKGLAARDSGTVYTQSIDGEQATRIIYTPNIIHCWAYFSAEVTGEFVSFFAQTIPAPNALAAGNQIWQWKALFETVGIVGFFLFLVYFILTMLDTRAFEDLKAKDPVLPVDLDRTGKKWLWRSLIWSAIFSAVSFPIAWIVGNIVMPPFFNQWHPNVFAVWSLFTGLFALCSMRRNYRKYAKANGMDLRARGVRMERGKLGKSILLGVLAAVCTYALVFVVHYLFTTDFRFWDLIRLTPFNTDKIGGILKVAPFFVFFYVLNSIAMNAFNYVKLGKKEWVNTLVMAVFNTLGVLLLIAFYYVWFLITGLLPTDKLIWGAGTLIMWIYPMVTALPIATVINRVIYKKTRNPYISSIAFALIMAMMSCANTLTYLI